jgi:hypothetical protein
MYNMNCMELLDDHLYLANEPQVKKAGFDLEVRRFSRTISKVAQTVTNTRRIRRRLEALVSRPELCSRLRPPSEKLKKASQSSHLTSCFAS